MTTTRELIGEDINKHCIKTIIFAQFPDDPQQCSRLKKGNADYCWQHLKTITCYCNLKECEWCPNDCITCPDCNLIARSKINSDIVETTCNHIDLDSHDTFNGRYCPNCVTVENHMLVAKVHETVPKRYSFTLEELAEYTHDVWSHWMRYFLIDKKGDYNQRDYNRWIRQLHTKYNDLMDKEKQSDRNVISAILGEDDT